MEVTLSFGKGILSVSNGNLIRYRKDSPDSQTTNPLDESFQEAERILLEDRSKRRLAEIEEEINKEREDAEKDKDTGKKDKDKSEGDEDKKDDEKDSDSDTDAGEESSDDDFDDDFDF